MVTFAANLPDTRQHMRCRPQNRPLTPGHPQVRAYWWPQTLLQPYAMRLPDLGPTWQGRYIGELLNYTNDRVGQTDLHMMSRPSFRAVVLREIWPRIKHPGVFISSVRTALWTPQYQSPIWPPNLTFGAIFMDIHFIRPVRSICMQLRPTPNEILASPQG